MQCSAFTGKELMMIKKVENKDLITALYCRLSQDDIQEDKVMGNSKD